MFDLPPASHGLYEAPPALVEACSAQAAAHFGIPPIVVRAIARVEGGRVGTVSKNTNGSVDLGVMQINSIHLPDLNNKFQVDWRDLAYKPCVNIGIGTWILAREIQRADGDLWVGVGNYHSRTPKFHNVYKKKVMKATRKLVEEAQRSPVHPRSETVSR